MPIRREVTSPIRGEPAGEVGIRATAGSGSRRSGCITGTCSLMWRLLLRLRRRARPRASGDALACRPERRSAAPRRRRPFRKSSGTRVRSRRASGCTTQHRAEIGLALLAVGFAWMTDNCSRSSSIVARGSRGALFAPPSRPPTAVALHPCSIRRRRAGARRRAPPPARNRAQGAAACPGEQRPPPRWSQPVRGNDA
jgi:hypothetical protein